MQCVALHRITTHCVAARCIASHRAAVHCLAVQCIALGRLAPRRHHTLCRVTHRFALHLHPAASRRRRTALLCIAVFRSCIALDLGCVAARCIAPRGASVCRMLLRWFGDTLHSIQQHWCTLCCTAPHRTTAYSIHRNSPGTPPVLWPGVVLGPLLTSTELHRKHDRWPLGNMLSSARHRPGPARKSLGVVGACWGVLASGGALRGTPGCVGAGALQRSAVRCDPVRCVVMHCAGM